jgi:Domain of unknown function (DUF4349)
MTTPEVTLEAVDAALAEGRVTSPEVSELQELALALRAESPRPSPALLQRLDERVAAGFPRRRRIRLPGLSLPPLALAGGAAAALIAVIVAVSLTSGGGNGSGAQGAQTTAASSAGEKSPAPVTEAAPALATPAAGGSAADSAAAPSLKAAPAPARSTGPRHVERSASLTLAATRNKLESVANQIVAVVDRHHGYVLHSSVTSGSDGGGDFDLRVPVSALQATLGDLSGLADVRARSQNVTDVTSSYNSTSDRLDTQRALRQSLLKQLAAATTDSQASALRSRLRLVSAQIRSLSAQFDGLRQRTSLASVEVSLVPKRARAAVTTGGIGGDLHDAFHTLAVSFGIALRVLGVLIPLAIVGGLAWLGAAVFRRRRREAALF